MATSNAPKKVECLDGVLGQLYEAAIDDTGWPIALTAVGDLSSSIGGHLLIWDLAQRSAVESFMASRFPEANADYVSHYSRIDPRLKLVTDLPVETTFACHHYFDDEFVRSDEFYNEFLLPHHCRFVAGCRLLETHGITAVFGLHRTPQQGAFEVDDLRLLRQLLPHVKRAVAIRQRLQAAEAGSAADRAALNSITTAVIVVAGNGVVRSMNDAAHHLLRVGDVLKLRNGRLGAKNPADEERLMRLVGEAASAAGRRGAGGGAVALTRNGGNAYAALVAPLRPDHPMASGVPMAIVLVNDPAAAPRTLGRILIEFYGFTQAEARLAMLLVRGRTLKEAADERWVGIETVRSQLRSLLEKSGTRRQADLVRLLSRMPETFKSSNR